MSAKRPIFPSGTGHAPHSRPLFEEDDEDMYTGRPTLTDEHAAGQEEPQLNQSGASRKGHAAYAAQDEMPPFTPKGSGFGGGMFTGRNSLFPNADQGGPFSGPEQGQAAEAAPAAGGGDLLSVITDAALADECAKRICPSCPSHKEMEESHLRAMADLENTKKRLIREREEQTRFAAESILTDIIPSLDNLDLALQHATTDTACKNFVIGVQMTRKLMLDSLAKHGLAQAGAVGDEFNPAVHEAVGMVDSPDQADGHVCELLSMGYMLNGRLLRPARVMVCKKG